MFFLSIKEHLKVK